MNKQEINNFTRITDPLEEEIFRLRKDLNESETLVDVLQRELHDARQELKIAHLEKDILRLELLQAKSAKFDESPWHNDGFGTSSYMPKPIKTTHIYMNEKPSNSFLSKGEK